MALSDRLEQTRGNVLQRLSGAPQNSMAPQAAAQRPSTQNVQPLRHASPVQQPKQEDPMDTVQQGMEMYDTADKLGWVDKAQGALGLGGGGGAATAQGAIDTAVTGVLAPAATPVGTGSVLAPAASGAGAGGAAAGAGAGGLGALVSPVGMAAGAAYGMNEFDQWGKKEGYDKMNSIGTINGVGLDNVSQAFNPMAYLDDPEEGMNNLANTFTLGMWDDFKKLF